MRTCSSSNISGESSPNPTSSNPKRRNCRRSKQAFILEESPIDMMADQRTMAELPRTPTEDYVEEIVVPPILAEQFELKHSLINMMTSDQFFGLEKDNPHDHIRWFNKITSTIKYKGVPNSVIKLMLFPFSLAGAARRTTNLRNEISNFQQRFDESFHEAWDRYKDLLRACTHHGFTELHQLDTFYNALNPDDQDSLNSTAGGNLLERRTQDVLTIIKKKSKVRNSRNKSIVSQLKSSDANISSSSEIAKLTHVVNQQTSAVTTAMTAILKQFQATPPPASVKAVEKICVTCGGAHPYYQCLAADDNTFLELRDNIQGYVLAAVVNYNQGNSGYHPLGYNQGNDFNQDSSYQASIQQNQVVPLSELEKIKKMNEINMKAMQTQINNVKNKLRNEMKTSIQASMSNQTNELKNMMASFFQMNTASTSGLGPLLSNTITNPKGELKSITTRSGIVLDGPSVPMPPPFINLEEDERVEETLTDPDLGEFTIKVPPPLVQKPKPASQRNYVVHQRDPLHLNIPYPSRMHKQKQQEKDEVQIHKFWQLFKQLHINITLVDALILIPKYQKMLKALLPNKKKLLELANTPLNENCSAVVLKKLPEKLGDPRKFLILCGFSDLKCKALADLEMILHDGDERLTLNMRHYTSSYSNQPKKESINMINIFNNSCEDFLEDLFATNHLSGNPAFSSHTNLTSPAVKDDIFDPKRDMVLIEKLINLDSTKDLPPSHNVNPLSGSTTSSSPNHLLEEFADELALITFPSGNDDLPFDIESDIKEIEYLLNHDPIKEMDSILEDSVDKENLADLNDNLVDTMPEMFTDKHALDYSSPPLYDEYDDDLFKVESDTEYVYDDPFDSKEEKTKEYKLLIDELDRPRSSDFLPSLEYDSFLFEDFSEVDDLPSTNNKDKIAISHAFLILEDFDPPLSDYELLFHKEVPRSETLLSFSSKNKEKVFKPGILTSKGVHSSHLPELSHRDPKVFKVIKIFERPMEIFPCSFGEEIRILDVPCLHFYPPMNESIRGLGQAE
nr:hypothetical protein [Tanacetum cinerariifolium]